MSRPIATAAASGLLLAMWATRDGPLATFLAGAAAGALAMAAWQAVSGAADDEDAGGAGHVVLPVARELHNQAPSGKGGARSAGAPTPRGPPREGCLGGLSKCFGLSGGHQSALRRGSLAEAVRKSSARALAGDTDLLLPAEDVECAQARAAQQAGRYLEASRLLGSGASGPAADHVRSMASSAGDALAVLDAARRAAAEAGSGWHETTLPGGIRVLYKYGWNTGAVELIADVPMDVEPLRLWALLREFDLSPMWNKQSDGIAQQATFAPHSLLFRCKNKAFASFLSPSETWQERTYVDVLAEHGALVMLGRCPDPQATDHQGVPIPPAPEGVKRVTSDACDVVTPRGNAQVVWTAHRKLGTPFKYVPNRLIGMVAKQIVTGFKKNLTLAFDSWAGSDFEARMRAGPREKYYQDLRERVARASAGRQK